MYNYVSKLYGGTILCDDDIAMQYCIVIFEQ